MDFGDRFQLRVDAKRALTPHITSFEFSDPEGRTLPEYRVGAHIELDVRPGLIRRYSLCGMPRERTTYRIAVLRDPNSRGGSITLHDVIAEGDILTASAPRNNFKLSDDRSPTMLFAGGIGITPIFPMAYELFERRQDFVLHYCTRSKTHTAFHDNLSRSSFRENVRFYFDDADDDERFAPLSILGAAPGHSSIYVCGPAGFIRSVVQAALSTGVPAERIHKEAFAVPTFDGMADRPFAVQLARTGQVFTVPAGKTIVEVLDEAGHFVPTSCRQGICGTCLTNIVAGEPDHRDAFLIEEERIGNDLLLPCCSRAKSSVLVLDL